MSKANLISDVLGEAPNRRSLLKTLGVASAALGTAAITANKLEAQQSGPTVVDVLQFALNLEYLESEFYTTATMGTTIDQVGIDITGAGGTGPTYGWNRVNFANNLVFSGEIAMQIGEDERAHVTLLRTALQAAGVTPIAKPTINLGALGIGFASLAQFLTLARIFEDIGVTAYGGAAALPFVGNSPYIGTAARILATEAQHAGNIRLQLARLNVTSPTLDGVDIPPPPSGSDFISADNVSGLTAVRTPGQVLYLAYGNAANATSGGFFPAGANGLLNTSTTSA